VKPEINPSRDREIMHIVQKGALRGGLVGVLWCHQQGRDDMTNREEWVRNVKTGAQGRVLQRYNRTSDGKAMVSVYAINQGREVCWIADRVELMS
jgi:hypothetical protein